MEKLLLFGMENSSEIKKIAFNMKIKVTEVSAADYDLTLEQILSGQTNSVLQREALQNESQKTASLVLFCEVSEKHLDKMLFAFRSKGITVDYKAVLTNTNRKWTVKRLFANMAMEKHSYQ